MSVVLCPSNCASQLPVYSFSHCDPKYNIGGIPRIYLKNIGTTFPDNLVDFTNEIASGDIQVLVVLGDKPAPTKTEINLTDHRKIVTKETHIINFIIDEVGDENYEAMRETKCGSPFLAVFAGGDYLYGGMNNFVDGIEVSITMDDIHPQSDKEVNTLTGNMTWDAKYPPSRVDNFLI